MSKSLDDSVKFFIIDQITLLDFIEFFLLKRAIRCPCGLMVPRAPTSSTS